MDRGVTVALVVIVAHLLAGAAHGYAHEGAGVSLTPGQTAFVWLVATAGPIAAGVLCWRGALESGAVLLVTTALAATVFDAYYHAIAQTADHVHAVEGPFAPLFVTTAAIVSITDLLAVAVGAWLYRREREGVGE